MDMKYYMPVKLYDGADCVAKNAKEWTSKGSRALLVTGKHSAAANGSLNDVIAALEENGKSYCIFDGVEENPSVETVIEAARFGHEEGADFCIGIGGGSAMDAAKAIAFLMKRKERFAKKDAPVQTAEDEARALYDAGEAPEALPVIAVPTTCGTGSEVTGVSVLTVHGKKTKQSIPHRIWPVIALIDGKYLSTASSRLIADTSVDAFAHLAESFLSAKADDYSRAMAVEGLKIWGGVKDVLTADKAPDEEERALLMRASTFAGFAIAQTGTCLPHALSYPVTYAMGMPHGAACGYFLTGFIREAGEEDRAKLLKEAGFEDMAALEGFMRAVLAGYEVPQDMLQTAYDSVVSNEARLKSCRFAVDADVLARIVFDR